jgi:hypothetical protein
MGTIAIAEIAATSEPGLRFIVASKVACDYFNFDRKSRISASTSTSFVMKI